MMLHCDRDPSERARVSFFGPRGARLDLCAHHARYVSLPSGWFRVTADPVILAGEPIVMAVESALHVAEMGP